MSDLKPSNSREERAHNEVIGLHRPRFELHFHVPRYPSMSRAAWSSLVTECTQIVMLRLCQYGMERVEIYGDGIKVFVVVPNDPNIKLRFFDGEQEEIQRQILLRAATRAQNGALSPQEELDRLTAFVVDHVDSPHGSLETNAELVDSVIALLTNRELARRILGRWDEFDLQVRALQVLAKELAEESPELGRIAALRAQLDELDRVRQAIGGQP